MTFPHEIAFTASSVLGGTIPTKPGPERWVTRLMVGLWAFGGDLEKTKLRFGNTPPDNLSQQLCNDRGADRNLSLALQQFAQYFIYLGFPWLGRQFQNPHIFFRSPLGRCFLQRVIGHPEAAGREQVLFIAVVLERPWLPHQPFDDVPVIHSML
jgi:hypothetical protein